MVKQLESSEMKMTSRIKGRRKEEVIYNQRLRMDGVVRSGMTVLG